MSTHNESLLGGVQLIDKVYLCSSLLFYTTIEVYRVYIYELRHTAHKLDVVDCRYITKFTK